MSKGNGSRWNVKEKETSVNRAQGVFEEGAWSGDWRHSLWTKEFVYAMLRNLESMLSVIRNYQWFPTRKWCDGIYVLERHFCQEQKGWSRR